jgi:hypothetical protein
MDSDENEIDQKTLSILNNPNSTNGLMTNVWGPTGWVFLHAVTFGYPLNPIEFDRTHNLPEGTTENRYRIFFEHAAHVFPCRYCRESYSDFIKEIPIQTGSRQELTHWLWKIHRRVNKKLNKKNEPFHKVVQRYESLRATCTKDKKGCSIPVGFSPRKRSLVLIFSEVSITLFLLALVIVVFFLCM